MYAFNQGQGARQLPDTPHTGQQPSTQELCERNLQLKLCADSSRSVPCWSSRGRR